jgi:predicted nuclease of predicted toxin-antitoxin system
MRFLVDECTGPHLAKWLSGGGYEVFSVFDEARGMDDTDILEKALSGNWILITNDKDFGEMVFRQRRQHHGVIFLRLDDERSANKIDVISRLHAKYSDKLLDRFVIVTATKVRFARS